MIARFKSDHWRQLSWPGLLLGTAVLLATSILATAQLATRTAIAQRQSEDLNASLTEVISEDFYSNNLGASSISITTRGSDIRFFRAIKNGRITAVAYSLTTTEGYGGAIKLLSAVNRNGELLGVRVLAHSETPGLGDKMEVSKSDWIQSFVGLSLKNTAPEQWAVSKDGGRFDQFTGATITPRALVKTVRDGLLLFQQQRSILLANPASLPSAGAGTSADNSDPDQHSTGSPDKGKNKPDTKSMGSNDIGRNDNK
ncbi:electron transport complex subunit RsxG [Motiliproteus sp. MSK22-1]|uniref:electron transport complex subunit RsxG n=1 Tax=Motiliproteus sp. MSK22-1 TaxID=1897630 RepID=UPI0009757380|nr:electron transport complex subunit RsxG [Motiliproteus sp. MSK22-1]OMH33848.1 hypothetical protein BGP75_12755 [Motiliproteus sp. MSK22-1]